MNLLNKYFSRTKDITTNSLRVILAFLLAPALMVFMISLLGLIIEGVQGIFSEGIDQLFHEMVLVYLFFIAGIIIAGALPWFTLHKLGFRQLSHAIIFGFIFPAFIHLTIETRLFTGEKRPSGLYPDDVAIWNNGVLTEVGWMQAYINALSCGATGICLALIIWYIAYKDFKSKTTLFT